MKGRKGGGEEIPLVQGKEQWLRFAGAAVKRYPTPKVRETLPGESHGQRNLMGYSPWGHTESDMTEAT